MPLVIMSCASLHNYDVIIIVTWRFEQSLPRWNRRDKSKKK